jgi:hypothetical protein
MQKRIIINGGKKYVVNVCDFDGVGSLCPAGTLWMQSSDSNWYFVNLTGTSGSNNLAVYVNQTPLDWQSPGQDFPYQLLYNISNGNVYQVYLSGTAGSVTILVNSTPAPSNMDYKPYLYLQSITDGSFHIVSLSGVPPVLTIEDNGTVTPNIRILENGDVRITEDGNTRILES